jgi:hypothetical protein
MDEALEDPRIAKLKTVKDCEVFEQNAIRLNEMDLARQARRRKVVLKAQSLESATNVERECLAAVYAYEETLLAKNGKRTRARRTWDMIDRHGILTAVERAVNRPTETLGYRALTSMGLKDFAFEAVILRYPSHFSDEAVQRSKSRIAEWIAR